MRIRFLPLLPCVFLLLATGCGYRPKARSIATSSAPRSADVAAIDTYFRNAARYGFSGSVVVARHGKLLMAEGYGDSDRKTGARATATTAFDMASLDKQFIAAGIFVLQQQGRLKIDDPISRFYPDAPADKAGITLHQIMSHTSGFDDVYWDQHPKLTRDGFIAYVLDSTQLLSVPGKEFSYSSANYWMLEGVIEHASGKTYEEFMRENVYLPAHMEFTGTQLPKWAPGQVAHLRSYATGTWPFNGTDYGDLLARGPAYRTVLSTAKDLFHWYLALRDTSLLTAASKRMLFTPVLEDYACGWNVEPTLRGTRLIEHGGAGTGGGMRVTFRYFPEEDAFFAILSGAVNQLFQSDYLGKDVEALLFGGAANFPPTPDSAGTRPDADALTGQYRLSNGGVFHIVKGTGDGLVVISDSANAIPILRFPELLANADSLPQNIAMTHLVTAILKGDYVPLSTFVTSKRMLDQYKEQFDAGRAHFAPLGPALAVNTLHERLFDSQGTLETQIFMGVHFQHGDVVLRTLQTPGYQMQIGVSNPPDHMEQVLAPSGDGYITWDFTLGREIRYRWTQEGTDTLVLHVMGPHGSVVAMREAGPRNSVQ